MKRGDYMKSVKITSDHFSILEKMKLGEIDGKNLYIKRIKKESIFFIKMRK